MTRKGYGYKSKLKKVLERIGYHQPDLRSNAASCLKLHSLIGQLKGKLTGHAYVFGLNASSFRRVNCFFFMKT